MMLEKYCVGQSFCSCLFDEDDVCPVVFGRCSEIETIPRMLSKCLASRGFDVELDLTAHGSYGHSIIIETAMVISPCRDVRSYV